MSILIMPASSGPIGWVYQYFNSSEERRKMREESAAPRNGRELAIRNQFFTPQYVVQFLCDNTLGRIWYEMRKGNTRLVKICEYMVRQPNETFESEELASDVTVDGLNQDELWHRPIRVGHRPKRDPRNIRAIDPACGSGHFLLYLFCLYLTIYDEAWTDPESPNFEGTGRTLQADYPTAEEFRKAVPGLILTHNLYGVDIDPRCAQIAQLALWMRAQRAFNESDVPRTDRPLIRRANIVIAEPITGDRRLVEEFAATLQPGIIGELFKEIVTEMHLAGELGSLLPIEKTLASSIEAARIKFMEHQKNTRQGFLPGLSPERKQSELDFSGIGSVVFFEKAEAAILASLKRFVSSAANNTETRRRLFADDAEHGIAFIDAMRANYDVIIMNPPFGEVSIPSREYLYSHYQNASQDIYTAFVDASATRLAPAGRIGVISSRLGFYQDLTEGWRTRILDGPAVIDLCADLGEKVLDGALVEAAAYTLSSARNADIKFFDLLSEADKEKALKRATSGELLASTYSVIPSEFGYITRIVDRLHHQSTRRYRR